MRDIRHMTIVAVVAALPFGLAACGGGGGSSSTTQLTPQQKCEADGGMYADGACTTAAQILAQKQADQRMAITDAIAAARTAVEGIRDDSSDGDVTAAEMAVAAVTDAIDAAADLSDEVKTAHSGTADALVAQLAGAKSSRQMAMNDEAERERMAAIDTAKGMLTGAEVALEALADDATDEEKRDAQRMVEAAANALRDALRMNGGSDADIEAAIRKSAAAKVAADALQATITAEADAEDKRKMEAIGTAQTALTGAEDALAELDDDATDKEKRDAHRAVQMAAAALIQVLEDNDGTEAQIAAAKMTQDSAKMMADDLTSPIEIADQRKAITDALTALATAVAAVDDEATEAEVTAADNAVTAARKAITDATQLPDAEKRAHGLLVDAHMSTLASAKMSRQIVVDKADEDKRDLAKAASNKVANTKKAAITAGATGSTDRPFDGTDAAAGAEPTADENYSLTVKHTGSAVEVTVADGHGDYDAKNDPKFSRAASFGDGQMLVRNDGTAREIIVLHTDIEAPKAVRFGRTGSGYSLTEDVDTDTSSADSYLVDNTDDASKLGGSRIVGPDVGDTKTLAQWEATGDNADNVFRGTLDGASGTFRCQESGGCTIITTAGATASDDNVVTASGVLWFTPDAGETVSIPDADYLTYGFWLDTTTKDGEIASYDTVQTFARSSLDPSTVSELGDVTGTATYEGDAAGVYVHETSKEDGTVDTATSGRFTADVALTAHFSGNNLRAENTIEGAISNFDLDGGPDNSWNVKLTATGIDSAPFTTVTASGGTGTTPGTWSGTFHGATPDTPATDDGNAKVAPPIVIGEFNANFVNGAVAGAYGARKQ